MTHNFSTRPMYDWVFDFGFGPMQPRVISVIHASPVLTARTVFIAIDSIIMAMFG